ncbi:hypothetical protein, partial [Escherichia coli]|uniref:hypothetical protein n=1 Tax=Escherichia coli TaxID=562 RepID=UPI001BAEA0B9
PPPPPPHPYTLTVAVRRRARTAGAQGVVTSQDMFPGAGDYWMTKKESLPSGGKACVGAT